MSTFTTTLARCTSRDRDGVLCWGVLATQDGSRFLGELPCGHSAGEWDVVSGHYSPDTPCDPACVYARAGDCECSCGGQNHSVGWVAPPMVGEGGAYFPGIVNDSDAFRAWMDESGRRQAIENVATRHKAARVAAETRFIRNQGFWQVINAIGLACGAHMDCLEADLMEYWHDLGFTLRADLAEERERLHQIAVAASRWIGKPGEKLLLTLRLLRVQEFCTDYGTTTLHTFETVDGAVVKWWASGESAWELDYGAGSFDGAEFNALVKRWDDEHPRRQHYRYEDLSNAERNEENIRHDARICGFHYALGAELEVRCTVKELGDWREIKETTVVRVAVPAEKKGRKAA